MRAFMRASLVAAGVLLTAAVAYAQSQASVGGVVRDVSGGVLPGVTVEVSSPALIERVRSTVTDGNGQYLITNLAPGIYSVKFSLAGFSSVTREGVQLQTGITANVPQDLRVGALEETIVVTGESPMVDVQSARQVRVMEGDTIKDLPSGRGPNALLSMIPGMVGGTGGTCTGGICGFTLNAFSSHGGNTQEGRLQVDGMGAGAAIGGAGVSGYLVDVANAQEISISLSGNLGESEVGGPVINIIPRSGGNSVTGSWFTSYTNENLFSTNNQDWPSLTSANVDHDYDVNGTIGGPLRRDRLWYFLMGREQGRTNNTVNLFRNLNEGRFGANYAPDMSKPVQSTAENRNLALRLTWQATQKNKFYIFWDEQFWCTSCSGSGSQTTSPEAATTAAVGTPNRVVQFSWTNPMTNKLLLEARVSTLNQNWGIWPSFAEPFYRDIPRISESGVGAFNGSMSSGAQTVWDADTGNTNMHLSAAYITGSHNMKVGYQATYMHEWGLMDVNNLRLHYTYQGTAASGVPVPTQFTMWARPRTTDERAGFKALYVQDSWTINRLTVQGAVRYDHSFSWFPEQHQPTSRFVPEAYTFPKTDGVSFDDITTRWGATWDVFGTGKTAIKYQMGKYLQPATVGGVYNAINPMRRSPESVNRGWTDLNNNRVVDCDFNNFADHTVAGGDRCFALASGAQFGRDPRVTGVGFTTTHCGRTDPGIAQAVLDYCNQEDQNLISGWGKRQYDWQWNVGVQHEVMPRLSAEVSYHRRWYGNFTLNNNLNLSNADYDSFSVVAPQDARLPGGGGYVVSGLTDIRAAAQARANLTAVTLTDDRSQYWHGVDTNVTWRAPFGLRLQGGTSTGRQVTDNCSVLIDDPANRTVGDNQNCHAVTPFQTNLRGTATYTIPKIDVLVSSVFQSRPGPEINANLVVPCSAAAGCSALTWAPGSTPGRGQTVFLSAGTTTTVNLLPNNSLYGDGFQQFDVKVAKVFRFAGTRLNAGLDIYNVLNSDAITSYNSTFSPTAAGGNPWMRATQLATPRFVRVMMQLDF